MPSTRDATTKLAPTRRLMLQAFLDAIDAFHVAQDKVANGIDPLTGAPVENATAALDAATARLTQAMHTAIDVAWTKAADDALSTMWGKAQAPVQAQRVLESEIARQKSFASRFALDVARGETEEKRKIPEPTRAAMYADAAQAGYQTAAALGVPDGYLIDWKLGDAKHCYLCPIYAAGSPYTRETVPDVPRGPSLPCRSRCHCYWVFRLAEGVTPPRTAEEIDKDRRFEERVLNPPPVPPGMRLPTPDERGTLRDLEIQRNFARRKLADAEARGSKGEVKLWAGKSRDLTGQIIDFTTANGVHHVPTFRVDDVIAGKDVGQRDIDRLTHFRGIDGVTISRAQVAAIKEATAAAKADVLKVLRDYPPVDAVSREEWRALLRKNGAPESAFGGELTRLAREGCDHEHDGHMTVRARHALGLVAAVEAKVPDVTVEVLPSPADVQVVNVMAETVRETLENHVAAFALLGAAGRRTGVEPYRVEVGPFDDWDLVAVGGTWVQGDAAEVRRFLEALGGVVTAGFAVATWQAMG